MLRAKGKVSVESTDPKLSVVEGNPRHWTVQAWGGEYKFSEFEWFTQSRPLSGKSEVAAYFLS